ncbi:MAG: VirB3 family type IV secretion system protein [Rhodocyclaceae bacterium]|jgi:type IV secretory pathway TrbD component|nr:VirB3 family type IV secretion system protein [Rhodocyclaceae bacterium]MCE2979927.1 VirB3 family type IV secretion system protein [Betaproteobacteria bacterium]MCA3074340.1 VirB3 family type IV secretion system protein [Rhodocyclaceae bacterium]MCA3090309.1 VirB3 family type IV secretion system protein [Rhodocyclaceae bacterium]MCA3093687.1 VirB3 family type IV secretion system protein [Rhodocyclaceae bacterium]
MAPAQSPPVLRSTPVYRSLLERKTIAGVEDRMAIFNATLALAVVMGSGLWYWLLAAAAFHIAIARMTRHDPWLRQVYIGYARQADRYDPWPRAGLRQGQRPAGFGCDLLC